MEFLEKKVIKSVNVGGDHGHYSLEKPMQFESCRERFAALFRDDTVGFFFKHPQSKGKDVAEFVVKIEELLKQSEHSQFAMTSLRTVLWVQPSAFWKTCPVRRSLFTGLLRAGIVYDQEKNNLEEALLSDAMPRSHLAGTKPALLRFLCGYTKYDGPPIIISNGVNIVTTGWKVLFDGKDTKTIRSYLKHPDGKRPRVNPVKLDLSEALWA